MERKIGTLQQMMDAAMRGGTNVKWSHIIAYLESHCHSDGPCDKDFCLPFESPLPDHFVPSNELLRELWYNHETGDSLVRYALKGAPSNVIAALCHLCPESLCVPDVKGRVVLHSATRYKPSADFDVSLKIIVRANPVALLCRDYKGRTPLHYLFWYHASHRSSVIVSAFCRNLPKPKFYELKQRLDGDTQHPLPEIPKPSNVNKVSHTAAIVPDAQHGCLPLHYAVVSNASTEAVKTLLHAYPLAKHVGDRFGRTPLAWYLGAGYLTEAPSLDNKTITKASSKDEIGGPVGSDVPEDEAASAAPVSVDEQTPSGRSSILHVSGEEMDPNEKPWWSRHVDINLVKLLLSSRVARTADAIGRYPLHWACHLLSVSMYKGFEIGHVISLETVQILLDHYAGQIVGRDHLGKSPVMVLMDTYAELQEKDWHFELNQKHKNLDLVNGGPAAFCPPLALITILTEHPDPRSNLSPIPMEDHAGRLPIHAAVEVGASYQLLELFIKAYPNSLVHTTEEMLWSPLHCAFRRPFTAPLQCIKTVGLLLTAYPAGKHGSVVDGRMAMKMEDMSGNYPLHHACSNGACAAVIEILVQAYEKSTFQQNTAGDLPALCLVDETVIAKLATTVSSTSLSLSEREQVSVTGRKLKTLLRPLASVCNKLSMRSSKLGMLPLHLGLLFQATDYQLVLKMLQTYPQAALELPLDDRYHLSVLDMHEIARHLWQSDVEAWDYIRELLFSFAPTFDSHRHRGELLADCVNVVVDEMNGRCSFHMTEETRMKAIPDLEISHTLSEVKVPRTVRPGRVLGSPRDKQTTRKPFKSVSPANKEAASKPKPLTLTERMKFNSASNNKRGAVPFSIYDDDNVAIEVDPDVFDSPEDSDDDTDVFSDEMSDGQDHEWVDEGNEERDDNNNVLANNEDSDSESNGSESYIFPRSPGMSARIEYEQQGDDKFDKALKQVDSIEENKEGVATPATKAKKKRRPDSFVMPEFMSEVALRLWTFFALYLDSNNPNDNYVKQVGDIFAEIDHSSIEKLISIHLPAFATRYLVNDKKVKSKGVRGLTFRDIASPKCRELIHQSCYFVGRYDFDTKDDSILIGRNKSDNSVTLKAIEWMFTTEKQTEAKKPGIAEEQIWKSGLAPAEVGTTFRSNKRAVWIKFLSCKTLFDNEVKCWSHVSESEQNSASSSDYTTVPLLDHFDATNDTRKQDRSYKTDINDTRFESIRLFSRTFEGFDDQVILKEYPYAIVYKACPYGSLQDYYHKLGTSSADDTHNVCNNVTVALRNLHKKGVVHNNVSLQNIVLSGVDKADSTSKRWALFGLSYGMKYKDRRTHLGAISADGTPMFTTSCLPPEMFAKLSPVEERSYMKYWATVKEHYGVNIDERCIRPYIDSKTGEIYVVKCYFDEPTDTDSKIDVVLPSLPYELVKASESVDMWNLGLVLFFLESGSSLFPTCAKNERLLDYSAVCSWSEEKMEEAIYNNVTSPQSQDLLFRLLALRTDRSSVTANSVLGHPFFSGVGSSSVASSMMIEKRKASSSAFFNALRRKRQEDWEKKVLSDVTTTVHTLDLVLLERLHYSPSAVIKSILGKNACMSIPCSYLVLPYKLIRSNTGLLTPGSREDIEKAQELGVALLELSKACHVAAIMKKALKANHSFAETNISVSSFLEKLKLNAKLFSSVEDEMTMLVSQHIESFRANPMSIAIRFIQQKLSAYIKVFEDEIMYLYFVDEYSCVPVLHPLSPMRIDSKKQADFLKKTISFAHLCGLYARGVNASVSGLVRLLFEAADPHIPPTWGAPDSGLTHKLDSDIIQQELEVLQLALEQLEKTSAFSDVSFQSSMNDNYEYMKSFIAATDEKSTFAGLHRVATNADGCIWTTQKNVQNIQTVCECKSIKESLKELEAKVKMYENMFDNYADAVQPPLI